MMKESNYNNHQQVIDILPDSLEFNADVDDASTASLTDVQDLSLDRRSHQRRSGSNNPHSSMSFSSRASTPNNNEKYAGFISKPAAAFKWGKKLEDPIEEEFSDGAMKRSKHQTLSMAYLQDASLPYADEKAIEMNRMQNGGSPVPTSPLGNAIESHMGAAMRLKHAQFSNISLAFKNSDVEDDYREYFWSRTIHRWRLFVLVAGSVIVALQVAGLLSRGVDGLEGTTPIDWVVLAVAAIFPLIVIGACSYFVSNYYMARWIHHLSLLFFLLVGPVLTIIRYTNSHLRPVHDESFSPAVMAPVYIVCLISSIFFLRLRFLHTLAAISAAAATWVAVVAPQSSGSQFTLAAIALFFACVLTVFISYDLERSIRTQYLSDSRFVSITRNLQSQLDGLERSLLAASGKSDVTPADLDSPLEKAMLAVRRLLQDQSVAKGHKATLELVMACLSSPNLLTPDLDLQLKHGRVAIDDEQEKWLFNEIARRKRNTIDPADAGQQQVLPERDDWEEDYEFPGSVQIPLSDIAPAAELTDITTVIQSSAKRRGSAASAMSQTPTATISPSTIMDLQSGAASMYLARVQEFNFPIFEFAAVAGNHSLLLLSNHLCVSSGLIGRLGLNMEKFMNGIATIESGYHADLAFHNSLHAADVLHCINYLVSKPAVKSIFSDLELLAIYVAAIVHDFDHPGVNNNFLIASSDRKALMYNDKSVLENHHCAAAFEVLSRPSCAFLSTLDRADFKIVREAIIDMVLATDLSQHFALLTMFKKKVLTADTFDPLATREDRTLLMQMLMKCADVSNPTKAWPEYGEWIDRLTEEWYMQGDREKALGLPVSPFMNRDGPNASNPVSAQTGFINFIVAPLYDAFGAWTDVSEVLKGLEANKARWAALTPPPAAPATNSGSSSNNNGNNSSSSSNQTVASQFANKPRRNKSLGQLVGLERFAALSSSTTLTSSSSTSTSQDMSTIRFEGHQRAYSSNSASSMQSVGGNPFTRRKSGPATSPRGI